MINLKKSASKESEVLNIFPVQETLVVLDLVIPAKFIKIHTTEKKQTILKAVNPKIIKIINDYFDSKSFMAGHESFHNDCSWVFPEWFTVEQLEVLPKESTLTRIKVTVAATTDFSSEIVTVDNDCPWEYSYIVTNLDGKNIRS